MDEDEEELKGEQRNRWMMNRKGEEIHQSRRKKKRNKRKSI